jgi:hypothetical protein
MRYNALAMRIRQATNTKDPKPTAKLLVKPLHNIVATILVEEAPVFAHVFATVEHLLSPETVLLDAPKRRDTKRRRAKRK